MSKKTKDRKFRAYRDARSQIRTMLSPYRRAGNVATRVSFELAGGDLDGQRSTNEIEFSELLRVVDHSCPPGGDDRFMQGKALGLVEALEAFGRVVYNPEYMVPRTRSLQHELRRMVEVLALAETNAAKVEANTERNTLQALHNHVFGPDGTGEAQDTLPAGVTVSGYAEQLVKHADERRRLDHTSGVSDVLTSLGISWPQEWADEPVTVERVVAAIRSYFIAQPQGQAVREARAQERGNILGKLGITVNPAAAPGHEGAVTQIKNLIQSRVTEAENAMYQHTVASLARQLDLPVPDSAALTVGNVTEAVLREMRDSADGAQQRQQTLQRSIEDEICRSVLGELGITPGGWAGISAKRADLVAALRTSRVRTWPTETEISARRLNQADSGGGKHPAVKRYGQIRAKYSVEHDAAHHSADDTVLSVISLLMGPDDQLIKAMASTWGAVAGHRLPMTVTLGREHMWRLGGDSIRRWAQGLPPDLRMQEAAALLLCLTDHQADR